MLKLFVLQSLGAQRLIPVDLKKGFVQGATLDLSKSYYNSSIANSTASSLAFPNIIIDRQSNKAVGRSGGTASKVYLFSDINQPDSYYEPAVSFAGAVWATAMSDHHYAVGGDSPFLYLFEKDTDVLVQLDTSGLGRVVSLSFNIDGSRLALVHNSAPYLRVYNTSDLTYSQPSSNLVGSARYAVSFSKDNNSIITVGGATPYISVVDLKVFSTVKNETSSAFGTYPHASIVLHPVKDNCIIVACGYGSASTKKGLFEYNIKTGAFVDIIPMITSINIQSIAISEKLGLIFVIHQSLNIDGILSNHSIFDLYTYDRIGSNLLLDRVCSGYAVSLALVEKDTGKISGTVRDISNNPAERVVTAHNRVTGEAVARTTSDSLTGNYQLITPDLTEVDVQFHAKDGELLNDLFYARVIPEQVI